VVPINELRILEFEANGKDGSVLENIGRSKIFIVAMGGTYFSFGRNFLRNHGSVINVLIVINGGSISDAMGFRISLNIYNLMDALFAKA